MQTPSRRCHVTTLFISCNAHLILDNENFLKIFCTLIHEDILTRKLQKVGLSYIETKNISYVMIRPSFLTWNGWNLLLSVASSGADAKKIHPKNTNFILHSLSVHYFNLRHTIFCYDTECVTDLDSRRKMIIFESILTTFEASTVFEQEYLGQYWKSVRAYELQIVTKLNPRYALYNIKQTFKYEFCPF